MTEMKIYLKKEVRKNISRLQVLESERSKLGMHLDEVLELLSVKAEIKRVETRLCELFHLSEIKVN